MLNILEYKDKIFCSNKEEFFLIVYFLVDELYNSKFSDFKRNGPAPKLSDSEIIAINFVGQFEGKSESAWHKEVSKNYRHLFPEINERSRFSRRTKDLWQIIQKIGDMITELSGHSDLAVVDSMPIPVCKFSRRLRNRSWADYEQSMAKLYGFCAAQNEKYFGFKLHAGIDLQGVITGFVLSPASYHDATVAPDLIGMLPQAIILGDKGYIGVGSQIDESKELITNLRTNMKDGQSDFDKSLLKKYRKVVETGNSLLTKIGIKQLGAKSVWGIKTRILLKIGAYNLNLFIRKLANVNMFSVDIYTC